MLSSLLLLYSLCFIQPLYPASLFDVGFDGNGLQPAQVKLYAAELVRSQTLKHLLVYS